MRGSRLEAKGIAYLFERFPSFTQTFCAREVIGMRRLGVEAAVYSIRAPRGEPRQDFPGELPGLTTYLPAEFGDVLSGSGSFRREARAGIAQLEAAWGSQAEKRRIYEAAWLAPELDRRGLGHVHCHFAGVATRAAYWLRRRHGVRYSFTAHANDIFCDEPVERLGQLVREAEFVVSVSDYSVEYLRKLFPDAASRIHRVYNGIDPGRFATDRTSSGTPLVMSVGRCIEKKGFADLIDACGQLGDIDFVCKIVGEGPLEGELKERVRQAGLSGRVEITGPMPESEVAALLARAAVFVLPCVDLPDGARDNLPTVIMEAMASSLPVVSTAVAGVPEMVDDGRTGFVVAQREPGAIADRMRRLLADPGLARRMGAAGRALCEERFASERTTAALAELLDRHGAFEPRRRPIIKRLFGRSPR